MLLFTGGTTTFILLWQYIYISIAVFVVSIMFAHDCAVVFYIMYMYEIGRTDSAVLLHVQLYMYMYIILLHVHVHVHRTATCNVRYMYVGVQDYSSYSTCTIHSIILSQALMQVFYRLKFSMRFVPF